MLRLGKAARCAACCVALASVAFVGQAAFAADKEVRVYNWSDYIDPKILEDFTKETGIKVVYDVFDSNEVLETKLLAGKTGYDVVVPTGSFLSRQITAGVFQKLDKSKIPNISNTWPEVYNRVAIYDPGNEYALNWMWGTTGVGYNEAKIKERMPDAPVGSLDMIFKPEIAAKFKDCGIYVLDSPEDIIPAGAQLSWSRSQQQQPGRSQEGRGSAVEDPAIHQEVPLVRIYQRARQRRHLHGARLVGGHSSSRRLAPRTRRTGR